MPAAGVEPSGWQLSLATALAPLLPSLLLGTAFHVAEGLHGGGLALLYLLALYLAFSLPVAAPAAILLLAAYLVLRRRGWHRWWSVTVAGALIGWLGVFILGWLFDDPDAADIRLLASRDALLTAACGSVSGLAFWQLARRPRRAIGRGLAGLALLAAAGELPTGD